MSSVNTLETPLGKKTEAEPDIRFEREVITPARASALLQRAYDPKPSADATATYAKSMKAGAWILNGQSIVIDPFGRVLDGVQRLNACVASDCSFETTVAYNVQPDTLHTLDQHRRRYFAGVLESRNFSNAAQLQRLMSRMIRFENGAALQHKMAIGFVRYDRVFNANPEIVEATKIVEEAKVKTKIPTMALDTIAFMALRSGPEARAKLPQFLTELGKDDPTKVANSANLVSFQIMTALSMDANVDINHTIALLILAFNDFVKGVTPSKNYKWAPVLGKLTAKEKKADLPERQVKAIMRDRAPFNGGFPTVDGYQGIREGKFSEEDADDFGGEIKAELLRGISKTGKDVEIRMMRITPERAAKMLEFNTGNRKVQKSHVEAIKRDIEGDRWMVNAQSISFYGNPNDPDPKNPPQLLNGQHRLLGIIEADMAIDVPIAVNIQKEAFSTFDIHAKKAPRSIISNGYSRILQAALRLQWKQDKGLPLIGSGSPTSGELIDTLERHPGLKEVLTTSRKKQLLKYGSSGLLAYFIYRIGREDPVLASEYIEKLSGDGSGLQKGDPILLIREFAAGERKTTRKNILDQLLRNWQNYRKWRNGESLEDEDEDEDAEDEPRLPL